MPPFSNRVIWITGASSGIGESLAYAFGQHNAKLVLSARREHELRRVAQHIDKGEEKVLILPMDLSDQQTILPSVSKVLERFGRIDILVNNAGISQRSLVRETEDQVSRKLMEVNFFGQVALSKAVLPVMLRQGGGHFVVMGSVMGHFGYPKRALYAASKHALRGYFESLHLEEFRRGIRVTLVQPGGVRTDISANAFTGNGNPYGQIDLFQLQGMDPDKLAQKVLRAVQQQRFDLVIGSPKERLAVWVKRFYPRLLHRVIASP